MNLVTCRTYLRLNEIAGLKNTEFFFIVHVCARACMRHTVDFMLQILKLEVSLNIPPITLSESAVYSYRNFVLSVCVYVNIC
jgi:hypothetical protein